jgi:hypothetical protein
LPKLASNVGASSPDVIVAINTPVTLLKLNRLRPYLDGYDESSSSVDLQPGSDCLLLGRDLKLAVDLGPGLDSPHVIVIGKEQLCFSGLAMNLVRRFWTGSLGALGSAVKESDLKIGRRDLRRWVSPSNPNAAHNIVHAATKSSTVEHESAFDQ